MPADLQRLTIEIQGSVQGVGFRPFVSRLASELGIAGSVANTGAGVRLEAEGHDTVLKSFLERLRTEHPEHAEITQFVCRRQSPLGERHFEIRETKESGALSADILPDLAVCPDCLHEIGDPRNRRYRYAFTNCTKCGPRYSILKALPYDRHNTTMASFFQCPHCLSEYKEPTDRRYHAEPNACPVCGPSLALWKDGETPSATGDRSIQLTVSLIEQGNIVAVKGLGGFHLMCDATNDAAVQQLRLRKHRAAKPFAVMFPSHESLLRHTKATDAELDLLHSSAAPIVLVEKRGDISKSPLAEEIAPGNPYVGALFPYTPLHRLIIGQLQRPLVATSANLAGDPIITENGKAKQQLPPIADAILLHNRSIARPLEDSVTRIASGSPVTLRFARGMAPRPITVRNPLPPLLALGGHLKSSLAKSNGRKIYLSQFIGDLDTQGARDVYERTVGDFLKLHRTRPQAVVCDQHPDYFTTKMSPTLGIPVIKVQHHVAHIFGVIAEHHLNGPVFGIAWDGTGYGSDGTVWGGEFFNVDEKRCTRAASMTQFALPGGGLAARDGWRAAMGALHAADFLDDWRNAPAWESSGIDAATFRSVQQMISRRVNAPLTSSIGRLFDAVASIIGISQSNRFEGDAAMQLEFAAMKSTVKEHYPICWEHGGHTRLDWRLGLAALLDDLRRGVSVPDIARKFHNMLIEGAVMAAKQSECRNVALSGGCFQNRLLLETAVDRLHEEGFHVFWPQKVPMNDGGLALGQVLFAAHALDSQDAVLKDDLSCV